MEKEEEERSREQNDKQIPIIPHCVDDQDRIIGKIEAIFRPLVESKHPQLAIEYSRKRSITEVRCLSP